MAIHLYTFGWNEARMLPFFFRHYEPFVDKILFYDDGSSDGTLDLLAAKENVELRSFPRSHPDSFSLSVRAWRNSCWKESRGQADWVIVTEVDEHLHHPAIDSYLRSCRQQGVTYVPALGYDMVTDAFPAAHEHLATTRTIGVPMRTYSKLRIFDPVAVAEVNFRIGGHIAAPRGRLVLPAQDELLLLNYKHLGIDYVARRHAELAKRLGPLDIEKGWGRHFLFSPEDYQQRLARLKVYLADLATLGYCPSRDHRAPRWWRPGFIPGDGFAPKRWLDPEPS
jgi:glycosyltransferase involved in cell wall biosynthesis